MVLDVVNVVAKGILYVRSFHIEQIYTNCVLDHLLYKHGRYDTYDILCKHHHLDIPLPVSSPFFTKISNLVTVKHILVTGIWI